MLTDAVYEFFAPDFYDKNETCIFISTYHSSEKLEKLKFDICIYDEAHRTAGLKLKENKDIKLENKKVSPKNNSPKIKDDYSFFKKLLENNNIENKIFLTATTKEYTGGEDDYYTMDDENIYGKIIAIVSAKKAKELKRICNYKIITIELSPVKMNIDIEDFFKRNNITDPKEKAKRLSSFIPKLWYGWFGRGTNDNWDIFNILQRPIKKLIKKVIKEIRKRS